MKTMKNTFKKSVALLAFVAVFAMIFTGCKKDDSSSSSGGGGNGPTPPVGNYGTITVANQSYTIKVAGYEAYYDEDYQTNIVTIVMADGTSQNSNFFEVSIIGPQSLPASGTYQYTMTPTANTCVGMFDSSQGSLMCTSGTLTVSGTSSDYHVQSSGQATPMGGGGGTMSFSVNFEGPMVEGH